MRTGALVSLGAVLTVSAAFVGCGGSEPAAETSSPAPPAATGGARELRLVAIGDSIPYNSPEDCPGCTGFVERYAKAVERATGQPVAVENLSEHNKLTLPRLLEELDSFDAKLAAADIIVVGIAHNTIQLNADRPCGAPRGNGDLPRWAAMDRACAVRSARQARPLYDRLYSQIASLREGKPTILRTINRYDDLIGWTYADLTPSQERLSSMFVAKWNAELCASAQANGFECADISRAFNGVNGLKPSGDLLANDYTHPSQRGNAVITRVLVGLGFAPLA